MASVAALKSSKKELRSSIKKLLSTVTNDSIQAQSTAVLQRLINFKPYQQAKRIGKYISLCRLENCKLMQLRLGHGKGFYDYFLHRYREQSGSQKTDPASPGTNVLLYGLALEEQFLKSGAEISVPVGEYDSLLHGLLMGDGEIKDGLVSRE
ncbi:hypothetical protein DID88_005974 [Monilinia fructigena]|uniref:5-formyltetrahydrofolate cyclo-ligase n=1 Tax=Monilinia fructigena TaxID=38457 RepID=A0A395J2I1_9HELO|nr:hypothetical protein DID88_005974 [Monilinia fructigena]